MFKFLKIWKTNSSEDNLKKHLITKNQLSLVCNESHRAQHFLNANCVQWLPQHASPAEPEHGTAQGKLVHT